MSLIKYIGTFILGLFYMALGALFTLIYLVDFAVVLGLLPNHEPRFVDFIVIIVGTFLFYAEGSVLIERHKDKEYFIKRFKELNAPNSKPKQAMDKRKENE